MSISRSNESLCIKIDNREVKEVDHSKYNGSVLSSELRLRIAIVKEAFNRKITLLVSKLNIELGKKLVRC